MEQVSGPSICGFTCFSAKCHCFPSQQNQVHSTGAERISHYTALGDAVSWSQLQMFERSFHVIPLRSPKTCFIPSGTARYVGSMFLSDTAMLRNGTKFVTDLPVREAGYANGTKCRRWRIALLGCLGGSLMWGWSITWSQEWRRMASGSRSLTLRSWNFASRWVGSRWAQVYLQDVESWDDCIPCPGEGSMMKRCDQNAMHVLAPVAIGSWYGRLCPLEALWHFKQWRHKNVGPKTMI